MDNLETVRALITLKWGEELGQQIYNALQGKVVEVLIKKANIMQNSNYYKNILDGHSFKVGPDNLSNYWNIFQEVRRTTGFNEDIDFYITGDATINAFCIPSEKEGRSHILNINSGLINIMSDDELRFVIGHEFGHLIDSSRKTMELISFIYPQGTNTPVALVNKIRVWQQLAEISADRCGFIACRDLRACISAFFKMSSGLDFEKMGLNFESFIEDNSRKLKTFSESGGLNLATHPNNLIRIEALKAFSECGAFREHGGLTPDELNGRMLPLVNLLGRLSDNELEYDIANYAATMGLILGNLDGNLDEEEVKMILNSISRVHLFPMDILVEYSKMDREKIFEICAASFNRILETHPEMRVELLKYTIGLVLTDNDINEGEVEFVFDFASGSLGFSEQEIAQHFAAAIQANFNPSLLSIG